MELPREHRALLFLRPDQAPGEIPSFVFGDFAFGDVAQDTEGADRPSSGIEPGDMSHVMQPALAADRVLKAILGGERCQLAAMKPPAQLQHRLAVVWMQVLQPELQGLEAQLSFDGQTADLAKPIVDAGDAGLQVDLVERQAGEIGARLQASRALLDVQLVALPDERVDEELGHELQPIHQLFGPVAPLLQAIEA